MDVYIGTSNLPWGFSTLRHKFEVSHIMLLKSNVDATSVLIFSSLRSATMFSSIVQKPTSLFTLVCSWNLERISVAVNGRYSCGTWNL